MKKRVLSLALAAAMALSLAPAALAAEEDCDPIIIGGNRGERPPTDPYKDHIDTLDEAAEKGYVLSFSEDIDEPIDLGSVAYGEALPSKTITMTNEGDKSLYLVSTGYFQTKVGIETGTLEKLATGRRRGQGGGDPQVHRLPGFFLYLSGQPHSTESMGPDLQPFPDLHRHL